VLVELQSNRETPMFSKSDTDFIDFLFGKLTCLDTDMIDLHDDDTCCDHIEFEELALDSTIQTTP